ncbi:MAG: GNAT family N-acetyltransferase [Betaproteobacteria bacterium]|nr:GNAT family N-acetyltransferase [Betaproteobacteria bacterium]
MDETQIRSAVLDTLKSIAPELDVRDLKADRPLRHQVDLDSMDWMNVVAGLHEKLAVDITAGDYSGIGTLDGLVARVGKILAAPGGRPSREGAAHPPGPARQLTLFDGRQVSIRPIRPDDAGIEADFVRHLSAESRYERFMVSMNELSPAKLKYLTNVDYEHHMALVATETGADGEIEVGVARYIAAPGTTRCEFAIAVADAWQGSGLAGSLMALLMADARKKGLTEMEGFVLAANHKMLKLAQQLGFSVGRSADDWQTMHIVRKL